MKIFFIEYKNKSMFIFTFIAIYCMYMCIYISKFTYARNFTGQFRYTRVIKRYEYPETQQFRCIGVIK